MATAIKRSVPLRSDSGGIQVMLKKVSSAPPERRSYVACVSLSLNALDAMSRQRAPIAAAVAAAVDHPTDSDQNWVDSAIPLR